ncbi:hypothetical protein [Saccharospirillum mangrovi]|uniref:hypothetical protein n=1 Tax=Saccharospirillum mangrovi TaxID=2161747 RepID=UPI000D379DA5|nr:hypothetical protein [Saccharospirillum mangrovi]
MSSDVVFPIFIGTWIVLGGISTAIFIVGKNAQLKRKFWPPFIIGTGLLLIGFVYAMGIAGQAFYMMVTAVALVTILNLRSMKFCDACGRAVMNQNLLVKAEYCSKCGEKLQ